MATINTDQISLSVGTLELALEEMNKREPDEFIYNVYRSACIKEFEIIIELSASLMRRRMRPYFGSARRVNDLTFPQVFREAARFHLISLETCERWLEYREYRNITAHHYGRRFTEAALKILPALVEDTRELIIVISEATDE